MKEGLLSVGASFSAVLIGLVLGVIVIIISNPAQAGNGLKAMLTGGFSNLKNIGQILYFATPIIMTGLAVGFASKSGLFNIGASGQFIAGAFAAVFIGVKFTFLPQSIHWIAALLGAMLAGAFVGMVTGVFKAFWNVNEVICCIMMNYIAMYIVNLLIGKSVFNPLKNQAQIPDFALPKVGLDKIFISTGGTSSANIGIFIAIATSICVFVLTEKTTFGFSLKACGLNPDAAKYAGINSKATIISAMAISGLLAGLGGGLLYLAGAGKGIEVLEVLAPEGFQGIPVALLGNNHPVGIVFSGLFVAYLNLGGFNMQMFDFPQQIIEMIIAVIIYFSAFSLFIKNVLSSKFSKK